MTSPDLARSYLAKAQLRLEVLAFLPTEDYTEAHGRAAYDGAAFVLALAQAVMRELPGPR